MTSHGRNELGEKNWKHAIDKRVSYIGLVATLGGPMYMAHEMLLEQTMSALHDIKIRR